jgi:hypothetical protein
MEVDYARKEAALRDLQAKISTFEDQEGTGPAPSIDANGNDRNDPAQLPVE